MSKWEDKYEKLKNGEFDERIDELKEKESNKTATREEYKECEKLSKAKNNLGKVENVLEYREKLKSDLKDLKQEIETRRDAVLANQESKKLEEELAEITEEIIKTEKELKNPEIKEDRKNELIAKREELYGKRDENNSKYAKAQKALEGEFNRKGELKDLSKKELEDKALLLKTRISKCNMVAKNLLNGASWDTINLKLDNWDKDKRFTKKKDEKNAEKAKEDNGNLEKVEEQPEAEELFPNIFPEEKSEDFDDTEIISDSDAETYKKNKQLMFEKKHPRLAKIQNRLSKIQNGLAKIPKWFEKMFGKEEKMLPEPEEKQAVGKSEKIKAASHLNKTEDIKEQNKEIEEDKSFREYIRAVAEKGMDTVSKEENLARQETAKEKLAQMREANRNKEAKKFGQDYADKSDYRNKDDGEER